MRTRIVSLLVLLFCAALQAEPTALENALAQHFDNEIPNYRSVLHDLNNDGLPDALVYAQDPSWCGSGGCTLFVFQGTADGYVFLSRTTLVLLPLAVTPNANHGWKSLQVYAKGTGQVVLTGSDKGYPLNPSLQPLATEDEIKTSQVLLQHGG